MSDLEKFIDLYKSVGVPVEIRENVNRIKSIKLEVGAQENIVGYSGFSTIIYFSNDGSFINQVILEE